MPAGLFHCVKDLLKSLSVLFRNIKFFNVDQCGVRNHSRYLAAHELAGCKKVRAAAFIS